jgi:hypothetical protein
MRTLHGWPVRVLQAHEELAAPGVLPVVARLLLVPVVQLGRRGSGAALRAPRSTANCHCTHCRVDISAHCMGRWESADP